MASGLTQTELYKHKKMARGWKFRILKKVDGLYYSCSENKGADQLCSYCEADLHLYFRLCKMFVFSVVCEQFRFEPHREKTGFLPRRKQRRRSASR